MRVWPGRPYPLGATWDGAGVNFALFSEHASKVELCLFDTPEATRESHRVAMFDLSAFCIIGAGLAASLHGRKFIRKGIDPFTAKASQLAFALLD